MKRLARLSPALLVFGLAACGEGATPLEPETAISAASLSVSTSTAAAGTPVKSLLCEGYEGRLADAKAILAQDPGNADLQESVDNLNLFISGSCN